ncbi:MAG: hypothetical protein WA421_18435 [Nitrososphaeraceae archaeon]
MNNLNRPTSFLVIPILEDLKSTMFESGDFVQEMGYQLKVARTEDIESAAFMAQSTPGTILNYSFSILM